MDEGRYPCSLLIQWKNDAEDLARNQLQSARIDFARVFIPFERNVHFSGRTLEISEIINQLESSIGKRLVHAITGLGGIGKSQIALEIAYLSLRNYDAIIWIDDRLKCSELSLGAIAAELGQNKHETADASISHWLAAHSRWLLIVDNLEAGADLPSFIPVHAQGHIIVTTREEIPQQLGVIRPTIVSTFDIDAATTFLIERIGADTEKTAELSSATDLCRLLDGLPLGIEQAAAYIVQTKCSITEYLDRYNKERLRLLERARPIVGRYESTVATTWMLNFKAVAGIRRESTQLLRLAAFCAPSRIPFWLFLAGRESLPRSLRAAIQKEGDGRIDLLDVLSPLRKYSLVDVQLDGSSFKVHGLVQEVIRHHMPPADRKRTASYLCKVIDRAAPGLESYASWNSWDEILLHVRDSVDYILRYCIDSEAAAGVLLRTIICMLQRNIVSGLDVIIDYATKLAEKIDGPGCDNCVWLSIQMAELKLRGGDLVAAGDILSALHDHFDNPEVLMALGQLYLNKDRLDEAKASYGKLLVLSRGKPAMHGYVIRGYMGMGMVELYCSGGKLELAEQNLVLALRHCVALHGKKDPLVSELLSHYCLVLRRTGRKPQARYHELQLLVVKIAHDAQHPSTPHVPYLGNIEDVFEMASAAADKRQSGGGNAPVGRHWSPPTRPRRNDLCPCGSWKKYKHCCGSARSGPAPGR